MSSLAAAGPAPVLSTMPIVAGAASASSSSTSTSTAPRVSASSTSSSTSNTSTRPLAGRADPFGFASGSDRLSGLSNVVLSKVVRFLPAHSGTALASTNRTMNARVGQGLGPESLPGYAALGANRAVMNIISGIDRSQLDATNRTSSSSLALTAAAATGNQQVARTLVDSGLNISPDAGVESFKSALRRGDHAMAEECLRDSRICMAALEEAVMSSPYTSEIVHFILSKDRPAFASNRETMNRLYSVALRRWAYHVLDDFLRIPEIRNRLIVDPRELNDPTQHDLQCIFRYAAGGSVHGRVLNTVLRNPEARSTLSQTPTNIPRLREGMERMLRAQRS